MINLKNIRLDNAERIAILNAIGDIEDEVYILGSRLNKGLKGGDIDLMIYSKKNSLELSRRISRRFFLECEEKIDVIVFDKDNLTDEQKAFINSAKPKRIK